HVGAAEYVQQFLAVLGNVARDHECGTAQIRLNGGSKMRHYISAQVRHAQVHNQHVHRLMTQQVQRCGTASCGQRNASRPLEGYDERTTDGWFVVYNENA